MNVAVDTNAASVVEVTSPSLVRVKAETTHKRPQSPQSHSKEALIPDPTVAQAEIVHRDCPQRLPTESCKSAADDHPTIPLQYWARSRSGMKMATFTKGNSKTESHTARASAR